MPHNERITSRDEIKASDLLQVWAEDGKLSIIFVRGNCRSRPSASLRPIIELARSTKSRLP